MTRSSPSAVATPSADPARTSRAASEPSSCRPRRSGRTAIPSGAGEHVGRPAGERRERGVRCRPARCAASLSVPSPASTTTTSYAVGRRVARELGRVRRARRSRRRRRRARRASDALDAARARACVTDEAIGFTIEQARRTAANPTRSIAAVPGTPHRPAARAARPPRSSTCRACPRLVEWREQVAREKRAAFRDEEYWGRPVPGFGDPQRPRARRRPRAGRARREPHRPGLHRRPLRRLAVRRRCTAPASPTSRRRSPPTTGSSCTTRTSRAAVRCAPPANKPTPDERDRCLPFLVRELALLDRRAGRRRARRVRVRGARRACSPPPASPLPMPAPAVRPRRRGRDRAGRRARLLPPESAEHVHRQAHRADARRRLSPGPASWPTGYPRAP